MKTKGIIISLLAIICIFTMIAAYETNKHQKELEAIKDQSPTHKEYITCVLENGEWIELERYTVAITDDINN